MKTESGIDDVQQSRKVSSGELNSWRRGFTPQAEIWNGRMAMFALAVCFGVLLIARWLFI